MESKGRGLAHLGTEGVENGGPWSKKATFVPEIRLGKRKRG